VEILNAAIEKQSTTLFFLISMTAPAPLAILIFCCGQYHYHEAVFARLGAVDSPVIQSG
jgi:hypothetical protein